LLVLDVPNGFRYFRLFWLCLVNSRIGDSFLDALLLAGWQELSGGLSG